VTAHLFGGFDEDDDGFVTVACHAGDWSAGPFPDQETAIDALIDHAVDRALNRPTYHVLETTETEWSLQHPITCFPGVFDCAVHKAMAELEDAPAPPGRHRVELVAGDLVIGPLPDTDEASS